MVVKLCPNLMVSNFATSHRFYTEILGFGVAFMVDSNRNDTDNSHKAVFGLFVNDQAELMLQDKQSLLEELPVFGKQFDLKSTSTIYLNGLDPEKVMVKLDKNSLIKGPFDQWYGMREVYFYDPDGYIICVGSQYST